MKRFLLTACALFLMTPVVTGQEILDPDKRIGPSSQSTWRTYTVKGEEFSVALPTLPAMTSIARQNPQGQKYRVERHLETFLNGVIYSIDVFENPEPKQSLEDFIAERNMNSRYDLTVERELVVNGFQGKEYVTRDKTRPATVQFFATEKTLYRFAAVGSGATNDAVKQFFSSISLIKPKNATEVVDGPGMPLVLETGERVYSGKEVTTKARLISKPEPQYTEEALRDRISGTVVLRVIFSGTGKVTNIQVIYSLPDGLTEACIDAARKIKFVPATKDGTPVSMWIQLEYNFSF